MLGQIDERLDEMRVDLAVQKTEIKRAQQIVERQDAV
tara:strand:+ start:244 stop:354 length:111 start_codon:yes stop_codon:yes gene_type:complete